MNFHFKKFISYKERIQYINLIPSNLLNQHILELVVYLQDNNSKVRYTFLKKLYKYGNSNIFNLALLKICCKLIFDSNIKVRLLFIKLLKRFNHISDSDKEKLFDKNKFNLFICAIEDENYYVKLNLIKILNYFIVPDSIHILIDVLVDDSFTLRYEVTKIIKQIILTKLKEGILIKCAEKQIEFLCLCLKEQTNISFQKNILIILSNIYYTNEKIFYLIFKENKIDNEMKLKALYKIVKNHLKLFTEHLTKTINFSLDNNLSLDNIMYVGQLTILKLLIIILKQNSYELSSKVKNDLDLIHFKFKLSYDISKIKQLVKLNILSNNYITNVFCNKSIELSVLTKFIDFPPLFTTNIVDFLFETDNWHKNQSSINIQNTKKIIINFLELLKVVYSFKSNLKLKTFKNISYNIVPVSIKRIHNFPLFFIINTCYMNKSKSQYSQNIYFIIKNNLNEIIEYTPNNKICVLLNEPCITDLWCCFTIKFNNHYLKLTEFIHIPIQ